jgi:hypothetical protein
MFSLHLRHYFRYIFFCFCFLFVFLVCQQGTTKEVNGTICPLDNLINGEIPRKCSFHLTTTTETIPIRGHNFPARTLISLAQEVI